MGATAANGWTGPAYQAANLEANNLSVTGLASRRYQFYDAGVGVLAAGGCTTAFAGWRALCSETDPGEVLVFLEERYDNFLSDLGRSIGAHVDGGAGNDHLGFADDRLSGGPANDITDGGPGSVVLDDTFTSLGSTDAGSGDDTQQGAQGNDTIVAGPGADTIDYASYAAPITVTVASGGPARVAIPVTVTS